MDQIIEEIKDNQITKLNLWIKFRYIIRFRNKFNFKKIM